MQLLKILLIGYFVSWLSGCDNRSNENNLSREDNILLRQYMTVGKQLYSQYCANCHQDDGTGFKELYPPLKNADYMLEDVNRTICIIKNGQQGSIMVNSREYNQIMPANLNLTDLEIAEITTFIYNRFTDSTLIIKPEQVSASLLDCSIQEAP